ncbi:MULTISPECIES: galactitol-1-phosphate 5-dehydrogenase [Oceanobacillus]|uniref:Galactitol-1-phosphate 5-dehydrogenase n=1 Tax=Oceanobacillus sojae TaxID=582851 RepID=A0A511ZFT2_9BACI|nr:galactitol-1-phosphate 5-dehydrogenase [Oceanobacillus sojae]GEN86313.1 galactitol-1-phosphate 5-dehydrogenase [Oceanobacillus sojae]
MEALAFYGIGDIRYEQKERPRLEKDDEVIIRVKYAGICGSDLSRYKKLGPLTPGNIFGHECSGVVEEAGSRVTNVQVGNRIAVCPQLKCGECEACKSGFFAACPNLLVIGAKEPGGFASYTKVPAENVLKLPDNVSFQEAALIEPSSVVLHGLFQTKLQPGKTVAVYGCGTIGLLACQWAKLFGAEKVVAIDIDSEKLQLAKELGADEIIKPEKSVSTYSKLMELTDDNGVDLAIEAAGSIQTSEEVFAAPKKGGEVLFLGIPYSDITLKRFYFERIVRQELTVRGSWNAVSAPFPGREFTTTLQFLKEGKLRTKPMISHYLPLKEGPNIFQKITSGKEKAMKVLFEVGK